MTAKPEVFRLLMEVGDPLDQARSAAERMKAEPHLCDDWMRDTESAVRSLEKAVRLLYDAIGELAKEGT